MNRNTKSSSLKRKQTIPNQILRTPVIQETENSTKNNAEKRSKHNEVSIKKFSNYDSIDYHQLT